MLAAFHMALSSVIFLQLTNTNLVGTKYKYTFSLKNKNQNHTQ